MKKIKLPYGIGNYKALIEQDYYFVDKTKFIEELESLDAKVLVFLRPRRFGKSLLVSMLNYYYGSVHKNDFDLLFSKYYIGKTPTPLKNSYAILHFDFSGVNTKSNESTIKGFLDKIIIGIKKAMLEYFTDSSFEDEIEYILNIKESSSVLSHFFSLAEKKEIILYVLIDEYDHFANEILSFRYNDFLNSVAENGFVRKFYEVIKTGTQSGVVDRVFITGVSPITVDSLTSGFNIASHLTLDLSFHEMMGFNQNEVLDLLKLAKLDSSLIEVMKKWYNGYQFSVKAKRKIFNSDMVLYFLSNYLREGEFPENMMDLNIASDYGKIAKVFEISDKKRNLKYLDQLICDGEINTSIVRGFSLEKQFDREDFLSLLFYMGVLGIKGRIGEEAVLSIPNLVIENLYRKFFIKEIEKESKLIFDVSKLKRSIYNLSQKGDISTLISLCETTLKGLSNRDFQNFDEKYIKAILFSYLSMSALYFIKSEYEVEGKYIDLIMFERSPYDVNYQFAIELKYIKKSTFGKTSNILEKKRLEAKSQMENYLKTQELSELSQNKTCPLKSYILIFVGSDCRLFEEII